MARTSKKLNTLNTTRDEIIADLIRPIPRGPGNVVLEFKPERTYCSRTRKNPGGYKMVDTCTDPNHGYTNKQLFDLGITTMTQSNDYFNVLYGLNIPGKMNSADQRKFRLLVRKHGSLLWTRIEKAVIEYSKQGGRGIYAFMRYETVALYFFANSLLEAQNLAETIFRPVFDEQWTKHKVMFVQQGDINDLARLNAKPIEKLTDSVKSCQKVIEAQKREIETYNMQLETLKMVQEQQYAIENVKKFDAA